MLALEKPSSVACHSIVDICSDSDDDDYILLDDLDCEEESIVSRDHVIGAVFAPEKPVKIPKLDSDSKDCILLDLEDTKKEFPKPMKSRGLAEGVGTFLDDNNNLGWQEVEIDELLIAVTESFSKLQEKRNVEESGRPIIVAMETQTVLGSQDSFISVQHNKSVQKLKNQQVRDDLEPDKVPAEPGSQDLAGSSDFGKCTAESGNEPMEIPATSNSYKSSNAGKKCLILASQKQKKNQETQTYGSNSEVVTRGLQDSEETSDPPSNGKHKNSVGNPRDLLKRYKALTGTKGQELVGKKKIWQCHKCGKNVQDKSHLILHLQSHNTTRDLPCRICGKTFKLQNTRYIHEQRHTESKVRCQICGMECKNNYALKSHLYYWHSDQERVQCPICHKFLATKYVLRDHINRVHG